MSFKYQKNQYQTLKPDGTLNNIVTPDGKSIPTDEYVYNKDFVRDLTPEGEIKEVCVDDHVYSNDSYDKNLFLKKSFIQKQKNVTRKNKKTEMQIIRAVFICIAAVVFLIIRFIFSARF